MKNKIAIGLIIILTLGSCITRTWFRPKDFTYQYDGQNYNLDELINIDGCFKRKDNSYFVFFRDGIFAHLHMIPDKDSISPKNDYMINNRDSWGTYIVEDSIIKTQNILAGDGLDKVTVNNYFFKIVNRNQLIRFGYISYHRKYIEVNEIYDYLPITNRIDSSSCWLLNKKWFYKKGYGKNK